MSIFSAIKNAIFGATTQTEPVPSAGNADTEPAAPAPADGPASAPAPIPTAEVDVVAVLSAKAEQAGQPLNWRTSIVDLMKLLGLDPSLQHRRELARELGYDGDTHDSAAMNIWLHRQVMRELARNGGKVPEELQH